MLLEYMAMSYGALMLLLRLAKVARIMRDSESTQLQDESVRSSWNSMQSSAPVMFLEGVACLVAWKYADFRWLWLLIGVLLLTLTAIVVLVLVWRKLMPDMTAESDSMAAESISNRAPPSVAAQGANTRFRVRFALLQITLLIVWVYAWRHLLP